jgi:hypothetical protein
MSSQQRQEGALGQRNRRQPKILTSSAPRNEISVPQLSEHLLRTVLSLAETGQAYVA